MQSSNHGTRLIQSPTTPRYNIPEHDGRLIDPVRPRPLQVDAPYTNKWTYQTQQTNVAGPSIVSNYKFPYGMISYYTSDVTTNPYTSEIYGDEIRGSIARVEVNPVGTEYRYFYATKNASVMPTNQTDYDQLTYRTDMLASYSRRLNRSRYGM